MSSVNNKEHNRRVVANIIKKNKETLKERERRRLEFTEEVLKDGIEILDKKPQPNLKSSEDKFKEAIDFHRNGAI